MLDCTYGDLFYITYLINLEYRCYYFILYSLYIILRETQQRTML